MAIRIRYATIEDDVLIADISHKTFYDTFAAENTKGNMDKFLNEQFTKGKLMLEVGTKPNTFLLAYDDDELAGYVKLRDDKVPAALGNGSALEVARLYAVNGKIGKGIGSALMQASVDIAIEKKKNWLWLGVWERNFRAIEFYKRWGFEKFGETDFLLGDDLQQDWLMKKKI